MFRYLLLRFYCSSVSGWLLLFELNDMLIAVVRLVRVTELEHSL